MNKETTQGDVAYVQCTGQSPPATQKALIAPLRCHTQAHGARHPRGPRHHLPSTCFSARAIQSSTSAFVTCDRGVEAARRYGANYQAPRDHVPCVRDKQPQATATRRTFFSAKKFCVSGSYARCPAARVNHRISLSSGSEIPTMRSSSTERIGIGFSRVPSSKKAVASRLKSSSPKA